MADDTRKQAILQQQLYNISIKMHSSTNLEKLGFVKHLNIMQEMFYKNLIFEIMLIF